MIRKFLDAQRIHNLTAYLQTLHRQSLANADHTTLLLNCYTKLKDSSKLEEFIKVQGNAGRGFRGCGVPGLPAAAGPRKRLGLFVNLCKWGGRVDVLPVFCHLPFLMMSELGT